MSEETELIETVTPDLGGSPATCEYHDKLTKLMEVLSTNMRWLVRIGSFGVGLLVVVSLAVVPYIWSMSKAVSNMEVELKNSNSRIEKLEKEVEEIREIRIRR